MPLGKVPGTLLGVGRSLTHHTRKNETAGVTGTERPRAAGSVKPAQHTPQHCCWAPSAALLGASLLPSASPSAVPTPSCTSRTSLSTRQAAIPSQARLCHCRVPPGFAAQRQQCSTVPNPPRATDRPSPQCHSQSLSKPARPHSQVPAGAAAPGAS